MKNYKTGKQDMGKMRIYAAAEAPCCDEKEVHEDRGRFVHENMPSEDDLYDLAELFKAFGDSTRIRILFALFEADICVCDLAESLGMQFDYVVSRAVASLEDFYPWVKGRYSKSILYLKGGDVNEEISTLMAKFRMARGTVSTWRVDSWLEDTYFESKFVLEIK